MQGCRLGAGVQAAAACARAWRPPHTRPTARWSKAAPAAMATACSPTLPSLQGPMPWPACRRAVERAAAARRPAAAARAARAAHWRPACNRGMGHAGLQPGHGACGPATGAWGMRVYNETRMCMCMCMCMCTAGALHMHMHCICPACALHAHCMCPARLAAELTSAARKPRPRPRGTAARMRRPRASPAVP